MRNKTTSKIFLDGGDAQETKEIKELLGFLDGQTTNPSLAVKNPEVVKRLEKGEKLSSDEALALYRQLVEHIAEVTTGPVSIQVFGNKDTSAEDMLAQARSYLDWIPNGFVKFPLNHAGLTAAEIFCQEGPVNMTLCFSQEQAAAVYAATKHATHPVFISPFVGRLDDRGECGMDVIAHILRMYKTIDGAHPSVLTASVRNLDHLLYALKLHSPAITSPAKVLREWVAQGSKMPGHDYVYKKGDLRDIPYQNISLDRDFREYNIQHDLTDAGLQKFWDDWRGLQE